MCTHFVACVVIQVSNGRNLQICYFSHYFEMHVEDCVLCTEKRKRILVLLYIIIYRNYYTPNFVYMKNTVMMNSIDIKVIPEYEIESPG